MCFYIVGGTHKLTIFYQQDFPPYLVHSSYGFGFHITYVDYGVVTDGQFITVRSWLIVTMK